MKAILVLRYVIKEKCSSWVQIIKVEQYICHLLQSLALFLDLLSVAVISVITVPVLDTYVF